MILLLLVMVMVEDTQSSFLKDTHSQDVVLVVGHVIRYLGRSKISQPLVASSYCFSILIICKGHMGVDTPVSKVVVL